MAPLYHTLLHLRAWHRRVFGRRCSYKRNKHDTLVYLLELFTINLTMHPVSGFIVLLTCMQVCIEPIVPDYW